MVSQTQILLIAGAVIALFVAIKTNIFGSRV